MKDAINGWLILLVVVLYVLIEVGVWFKVQQAMPAIAAQIAANEQLVTAVNGAFTPLQESVEAINGRLDALENAPSD